jgi:hypothetical protein
MNNEIIRKYYVELSEQDKFTKNQKTSSKQNIVLRNTGDYNSISFGFTHVNIENSDDCVVLEISYVLRNKELAQQGFTSRYLSNGAVYFLIDDNDSIKISNLIAYEPHETMSVWAILGQIREKLFLHVDIATFIQLACAKKIEYRIIGDDFGGDGHEGILDHEDLLKIKGFYNAVFDSDFCQKELIEHIEKKTNEEASNSDIEFDLEAEDDLESEIIEESVNKIENDKQQNKTISNKTALEKNERKKYPALIIICLFLIVLYLFISRKKFSKDEQSALPEITIESNSEFNDSLTERKLIEANLNANIVRVVSSGDYQYRNMTFSASNMIDGDYNSWWTPNPSNGEGAFATFFFAYPNNTYKVSSLKIINGSYGKYYFDNSRISTLRISFDDGESEYGKLIENQEFQTILFAKKHVTSYVKIEIIDKITGKVWDDICISELQIIGCPTN